MVKTAKKSEHLVIQKVLNSLEIVDKDNIKAAIWLSRAFKAIDAVVSPQFISELETKLNNSEFLTLQEKIRTDVCTELCEKDADGLPVFEDVLDKDGNVTAKKYKIADEDLKLVESKISAQVQEQKEKLEELRVKYVENVETLNKLLDEVVEVDYPTISQELYEKVFKVDIQQIFVIEDLITE